MAKLSSLLILIFTFVLLGAQEIIFERYEDGTDFWVIVPYNSLNFKKDTDSVSYQLSIEIRNQRKKLAASFGQTLTLPKRDWLQDTAIPVLFNAQLEPGKYDATLQLRNLTLGDKAKIKKSFIVSDFTSIGQAYLIAQKEGLSFLPSSLSSLDEEIQSLEIRQRFTVEADSVAIFSDHLRFSQSKPASPLKTSLMSEAGLPSQIEIVFYEGNIYYKMQAFMYSPWFSYNLHYSLKEQLQQLRYLANQNQWQSLSQLSEKELAEGIELFWQSRDPSPGTIRNEAREEFNSRVIRADKLFTVHKKLKGWSSDRGRIYIKFGEPDEILEEIHPVDAYPSITWIYYHDRREFIFSDTGGYGQYTLRNKDAEYIE